MLELLTKPNRGPRLWSRTLAARAGLCVSLCLVGARALATTQVLAPSDDTFINSGYPLNNNGGSSSIFTGIDDQAGVMRALIRFGMPAGLQGRVTVTNVQLNMTVQALENGNPGAGATEFLRAVTEPWAQGNGVGDVPVVGQVTWISAGMNVDVQSWIDAPSNNHGWRISSSAEGTGFPSSQRFYSTESALSAPNLAISYVCKPAFLASGNDCTTCTAAANADCAVAQGNFCADGGPPSTTYTCTCGNPAYVPGIAGDGNPVCLVATETPTVTPSPTPTPTATATPHGKPKADLLETMIGNPPAAASRGSSFTVVDTVTNLGNAPVGPSITQYYLSRDAADRGRDQLLLGQRLVPALAPLAESIGAATIAVGNKTRPGSYFLLVCADDRHDVQEDDERNNCITSTGMVAVTP